MRTEIGRASGTALLAGLVATAGCSEEAATASTPRGAAPPAIEIAGADVVIGVWRLPHTYERRAEPARISQGPITVAEYRECVEAGACRPPADDGGACAEGSLGSVLDRNTYEVEPSSEDRERLPVTCVTAEQAQRYCAFVGGSLPSIDQWLLAARGQAVQRFTGAKQPTCETHWRAAYSADGCCAQSCDDPRPINRAVANGHATGMQRVLFTPGEMVGPSPHGRTFGCATDADACSVYGGEPGAIDTIRAWRPGSSSVVSFRCAWEDVK